jgi:hypothetical protein
VDEDIGVSADGRGEVRVERHVQSEVVEGVLVEHAGAEIPGKQIQKYLESKYRNTW